MRFPYGSGSWYNAQKYGVKTNYGYHEGDDWNLTSGGDSDLGQPLYAITDGIVTSVHNHTTKPTFGLHVHIQHDGKWGTVYSHYAHLQSCNVAVGDRVTEGQEIGKLGKSGTDAAHLHFAIKNQPTGIDGIAKTLDDLKKWENPTEFINKWKTAGGGTMQVEESVYGKLVANSTKWDGIHKYLELSGDPAATPLEQATNVIGGYKSRGTDLQNQLAKAEAEVKNRDEQVSRLKDQIASEQNLNKSLQIKLNDAMSALKQMAGDYEGRISVLQGQVDAMARDKGELNRQLALLEAENAQLKKGIQTDGCFEIFIDNIKKLFRR